MRKFEDDVIISGLGQSAVGRTLGRSALSLTLDAIQAALDDAGLTVDDIDGLTTYPGGGTALGPGMSDPSLSDVYDALGISPPLLLGNYEGPAQMGPVFTGALAVSSGVARHVLAYRTVTEGSARARAKAAGGQLARPSSHLWIDGLGGGPAPIGIALLARRHFHQFGTTREQLGQIAVTDRKHAALNPKALFRDPMSLDDYLSGRMIDDPLCLYDCDVHCDGSTALVLSHVDYAADTPATPIHFEAMGVATSARPGYAHLEDLWPGLGAAKQMWARTDLKPSDVQVAGVYDGFSMLTMLWLEALGFCGLGESGSFVEGGSRISLGGDLPINTNGGQLSGGRLHGFGFIHETCLQLRGDAGERQVDGAGIGAVCMGAIPNVGCMVLRAADA